MGGNDASAMEPEAARLRALCDALLADRPSARWSASEAGTFIEPQLAWERYTGQPPSEHLGMGWIDAIHPDDHASARAAWTQARLDRRPFQATYRLRSARLGGRHAQVVSRAAPVAGPDGLPAEWAGVTVELAQGELSVTELQQVKEALAQRVHAQTQELRRIFDLSLDILMSMGADGRLIMVSPSFERVMGVPADKAAGQHFSVFVPPQEIERIESEIGLILGGRDAVDFETRVHHGDGTERIVSWRAAAVRGDARFYAVGRDVTEQKQAEQSRIRAERLEAIGRLTGGIAHDFNNILAAITGYLEVGLRASPQPEVRKVLDAGLDASRRGAKIVGQLLSFARRKDVALQAFDLNELVEGLQPLVQQAARGGLSIELELEPGLPEVLADPTQVEMVVLNLCLNSRDAMPSGGTLKLRTWHHEVAAGPLGRGDLKPGAYAGLSVIDDGMGMDAETLTRCFEPFFTTKGPGRGTGLGLAQALGVVQHCGGTMRVDSTPEHGTRVDVFLPRAPVAEPPAEPGPMRVLVVDDHPDVLDAMVALLEILGFAVLSAPEGRTALALLEQHADIGVVLTDFNMPGMNGAELLEAAWRSRPGIPGIVMTGEVDLRSIRARLPGTEVLQKPLNPARLEAQLLAAGNRTQPGRPATAEPQPQPH
ncbi:PAS domain-containing hybrid sensor histidine kinase/response regulator [Ramlibacter humi]|uniref:histidine kinase n=1 Tax=Ramlibacter humi TaxID=2530451 RepID=A0A4Z0CDS3_9BURK|nr:PAS domain S-box protein [Ramlibacter humi]TFZ08389.1 PAS domain S-box protein [Ramlibacter humi]